MKRICLRKSCTIEFEPNKPKQLFCSAKCRVYHSREKNKKEAELNFAPTTVAVIKEVAKRMGKEAVFVTSEIPPMPVKEKGEDAFDFAARKNEWKKKYNQ